MLERVPVVKSSHTSAWATDTLIFQRMRARIIKGLVQLAGCEPARVRAIRGDVPELSDDQRRDVITRTLQSLDAALHELSKIIGEAPSELPRGTKSPQELRSTIREAMETVERILKAVPNASPEALKEFPEQARPPLSKLINEWWPLRKIFVAVHGIGDQFHNQTVQSVAFRVCDYVGMPAALPLGRFHGGGATVTGAFLPDPDRDPPLDCGFAEIYWADVPRGPAAEAHTLEEPTKWAGVLVERLRLQTLRGVQLSTAEVEKLKQDDERLMQLLEELIKGIDIADRLVFLAEKAGLFQFNLKKLLNDYLNDVQVVTEFEDYRQQLLGVFDDVLEKIHRYFDQSEIYIIAHSEGTVVSFMGLLKGLHEEREWAGMIKGLMTIGSPLNKHIRFWPELFDQFNPPPANSLPQPIAWKNYYDYGDPIGFDLKPIRDWMAKNDWSRFFKFQNPRDENPTAKESGDDIGFTRYPFPGEAHNEYWNDPGVFGHFIEEVVDPPQVGKERLLKPAREEPYGVPTTNGLARITSYIFPYLLAAALMFLASYILYKAARACLDPDGAALESPISILVNVSGLSLLIAGTSILSRVPRLTKQWGWGFLALISLGYLMVYPQYRDSIGLFLVGKRVVDVSFLSLLGFLLVGTLAGLKVPNLRPVLWTLVPVIGLVTLLRLVGTIIGDFQPLPKIHIPWSTFGVILVALAVGGMAAYISWRYPRSGTKPLVHTGGLVIALIIAFAVLLSNNEDQANGPIWPLFLAGITFLYVWWLAIVLFDMTFVWHLYIRYSAAQKYLDRCQELHDARAAAQAASVSTK